MSIELDPQEVLEHLYSLGYYNITKEQLKEFIKDLKKLIKYDLRKEVRKNRSKHEIQNSNKENACVCSISTPTENLKEVSTSFLDDLKEDTRKTCLTSPAKNLHSPLRSGSSAGVQNKRVPKALASLTVPACNNCACHNCLEVGTSPSKKNCSHVPDDGESDDTDWEEECLHLCTKHAHQKNKTHCASVKKTTSSLKPCPSFIRPASAKAKPPKADPVALYHYYKSLWSQHHLPGESSHENLRWRVRHKMMAPPVLVKGQSDEKVTKKPDWVGS